MPDPAEGGNKEFTAFLKACRPVDDLTSGKFTALRGAVYRSGEAGVAIQTADGQVFEIDASAVDRFKVVGTGLHPDVELSVTTDALKSARQVPLKSVLSDQTILAADQKAIVKDVRTDPIADNKLMIKDIHTDPIADQTLFALDHKSPLKDVAKDPITDPIGTVPLDNGGGTLAETTVEGGGFDPGQVVTNPAVLAAQQAGMTPFVMATPHHAPAQMVNLQMGVGQQLAPNAAGAALKPLQSDTLKEVQLDHTIKEVIQDSYKEVAFDTRKELIFDTQKEVLETLVEGGGTLQEGSQIPGGIPGMPGF